MLSDEDSLTPNDEDFLSETPSDNQDEVDYDLFSGRSNSSIDSDDLYTLVDPVITRRPRRNEDYEGSDDAAPIADQLGSNNTLPIPLSDDLQPSERQSSSPNGADNPPRRLMLN